ncbi:MAG: hypothetical protein SFX73_07265 [Kofleriaceae bacterium]|nr:hypothetical protein [Kofleriaceae bacterium]
MQSLDQDLARVGTVLVDEGALRRIIKAELAERGIRGAGLRVPHHHCFVVPKAKLERIHDLRAPLAELPDRVTLVTGDRDKLAAGDAEAMSEAWRLMFHARVHQAYDALVGSGELTAAGVRERIGAIGQTEFDEIRSVLRQEDLLVPPVDDAVTYIEFVALYLELHQFSPRALEHTFPAIADFAAVDATIRRDIDPVALLAEARPPRAPEQPHVHEVPVDDPGASSSRLEFADRGARKDAERARKKGNLARAAILDARAGDLHTARMDLVALVKRLASALGDSSADTSAWVAALLPVVDIAGTQVSLRFNIGARLLHDLQAACTVAEREVKVVDIAGWLRTFGKRPIVRSLPATREVRIAKHVHHASERVASCELETADQREALAEVLHDITRRADTQVRTALRPKVEAALDEVGLEPHSLPERVAEKKLVDELLDRAVSVGRLTLGDLRDKISGNDLKLPDLSLEAMKSGDQLLRADRILATSLDGVYRSGEIYLRFLQKISSVLFGTPIGRLVTRYALLPLLGSLAVVEGLQHMVGPLMKKLVGWEPVISTTTTQLGGAIILLVLLYVAPARRAVVWILKMIWRVVKLLLYDIPGTLWRQPFMRRILESVAIRWVVRPALLAAIILPFVDGKWRWPIAGGVMLIVAVALNSRLGQRIEERLADWTIHTGRQLTTRFLPGLVRWTLDVFGKLADLTDRGMYRVDELLRFRAGQSTVKLAIKGVLGAIWYVIAYVLRIYVDLFIEPTTNPIKHFPVVTVAAKIIIPIIPAILSGVAGPASTLFGPAIGNAFAGFTVIVLPGLAGFLVWEFKENWKLYRATRGKTLAPLVIGHHGETMISFLKPGFHSGTIPKLFTKLRRAAWRHDDKAIVKQHDGLHHVEEAIAKFADRQLVSMLVEVQAFRARDVALERIAIGSNRVQITLVCPSISPEPATIRFELQSGWIVCSLAAPGWTTSLDEEQQRIFAIALAGFYKLSGVDLVREQLEKALRDGDQPAPPYDVADEGLVVWPGQGFETEAIYDLRANKLTPVVRGARYDGPLFDLGGRHALFGREPLFWSVWSTTWQQIARGETPMQIIVGPSLLRGR